MTKDEALRMALEALNTPKPEDSYPPLWRAYKATIDNAITAIKEALQSNEQVEPVAEVAGTPSNAYIKFLPAAIGLNIGVKLYTHPPVPTAQTEQEPDEVDIRSRLYQRIHELETQLTQIEQEPAAWIGHSGRLAYSKDSFMPSVKHLSKPLYTTPPQRTWVGLTDVEWMNIVNANYAWRGHHPEDVAEEVAKLVETKLKEKNT